MKNHHFLALAACSIALTLLPLAAHADKPASTADKGPETKHGKPGEHGKPDRDTQSDKGPKGEHGKSGADADKPGAGATRPGRSGDGFRGGMRQLHEDLKAGKLKKEDLKDKLNKLRENSGERGKQHRQELGKRWGSALAMPPAREELRQHARRMAFLNRAMVLAETEAKDKNKDKLLERISKLIDKENQRHERAMERFKSTPAAAASAPPAPSAAPAAAAAASSAEGAAK